MVKIIRQTNNTYCVIDYIYIDNSLIGTQSNTINKNRFGAKEYRTQFLQRNGKTLNVTLWEHYQ